MMLSNKKLLPTGYLLLLVAIYELCGGCSEFVGFAQQIKVSTFCGTHTLASLPQFNAIRTATIPSQHILLCSCP
jgi:hypothetical protein